ncbi:MAG: hypothetical protein LBC87_03785 [Fibromonadaceae bacterium]|jgi:hypothetical protein|nr:hypothetical protein [Fibromonadaceae bacterium]
MKNDSKLWFLLLSFGFIIAISCNSHSILRDNTNDRYEEYKSAYKHYSDSEIDYIILLENLEKYPKDEYLLVRKQILRKEIEQNRLLMLQTRVEFEKALQEWDFEVQKRETGVPTDSIDIRQIFGLPTPKDTSLRYRE